MLSDAKRIYLLI